MIKTCFIVCSFFILSLSTSINAVEVNDLYQAKVPVASQSSAKRNNALKKAMQAVLVKVGGQESVLTNSTVRNAVNNHRLYVTQFSYSRENIKQLPLSQSNKIKQNENVLLLQASFDEDKINALLQEAELPLWGSLRPQVILWVIEEDRLSRKILSESSHSNYPFIVNKVAQERGLPVIMPLMDFTDSTTLSKTDVWGRFVSPVSDASERYGADIIVVVRISNSSLLAEGDILDDCQPLCDTQNNTEKYVLDWTLFNSSVLKSSKKQYQGSNSDGMLTQALEDITDAIYQGYALSSNTDNEMLIDVANIDSMQAYVELVQFLEDLSSVNAITLVSAQGNNRRFNLNLLGSKAALLSSLKLDNKLKQYVDPLGEIIQDAVPVFYWGKP